MRNQKDRKSKKVGKKSVVPSFLTKLYQILENSEYNQIVKWAENGKAFVVKNLPDFIERVLPSYFKHNNFASFVRQLNMYDFHKTRNCNNENTFYHKMFNRGQKNLLKLIKRKVNNNRKNSLEDSDFSDYQSEWRGGNNISSSSHNPHSKKNIEEIYTDLVKNLEEVGKKQKELELKASLIEKKNDSFVNENLRLTHEMKEKRAYTKNLEIVIYFIFELMMKKRGVRETDTASTRLNAEDDKLYEDLSSLIIKNPDFDLTHINSMIEDDEKANLMRNLMENINENVLKTVIENSLQKYGLTMDDINLTISKKGMSQSSLSQFIQELNNCHNCEKKLKKLPSYDFETNLSSPTSLISTTDLLRSLSAKSKSSTPTNFTSTLLNIKRKRTDESIGEFGSGNLNLNQKEKETFFDEITGLTPQLISSPNMSPARAKKSDAAFLNVNSNSNNIFGPQSHKNSVDNLYAFSLEDNLTLSNIINVDEKRIKDN